MDSTYLVQLKGNGVETMRLLTIKKLFELATIKHDFMEVYFVQFGRDPMRLRWGYDGVTLYLYDRYGNVFDRYSKD